MKEIIKRISNLLTIKSLLTISLTIGFLFLTFNGEVGVELFMAIYGIVISFYFSTQANKKDK